MVCLGKRSAGEDRIRAEHFPCEINAVECTGIVDDATLEDTVRDSAVIKENRVLKGGMSHRCPGTDHDASCEVFPAFLIDARCRVDDGYSRLHECTCGFEIGVV